MNATKKLEQMFQIDRTQNSPVFRDLTEETYDQLSRGGIYNIYGRRMNITPRVYDENEMWTGEYKDWNHLQEINIRQGYFEYLNALWLFMDLRPDKNFRHFSKEAYIFDKKCIVIQEVHHDYISAKILTDDEELKLYIEDILLYKPMNIVPKREIREINELEYQGLKFGSNQININVNEAEEKVDKQGLLITNSDHYDNYIYEVYDSLRNIFKNKRKVKNIRAVEAQCIWLEEWMEKPLTNDINSIIPYMSDEVIERLSKYTYKNKNPWDRQACGSFLFEETKMQVFDCDTLEYTVVNGKKMDSICQELDIPITVGWDIWKILNKDIMKKIVDELYEEYPL